MGSLGVGHDSATSLSLFTFVHWQPTPVFLPGESQGWGSLVGTSLWGRTESVTTEATQQQQQHTQNKGMYLKWIINKNLLYWPRSSAQCFVAACRGGEFRGE